MRATDLTIILFGVSLLLDGGVEAGFIPWGISGQWYLTATVVGAWILPRDISMGLSIGGLILLDALQTHSFFFLTAIGLLVLYVSLLARQNGFRPNIQQLRRITFTWILLYTALQLFIALPLQPNYLAGVYAAALSAVLQLLVWAAFLRSGSLVQEELKRAR